MTKKEATKMVWVTLTRSPIGTTFRHKATLHALGLRRLNQTVEQADTPQLQGMLAKVRHLVSVEDAPAAPAKEKKA
jgi:large subunit ribosomal protein L30